MAHHKIEYDCECPACNGTGIYVGFAERDGAGVVCRQCRGAGKQHKAIEYDDFEGRKKREKTERVYECNPGISIGKGSGRFCLHYWGGMSYSDWLSGLPFPPGSEMRVSVCPAWWAQSAGRERRPEWAECNGWGGFTQCEHFKEKHKCWERWDREFGTEAISQEQETI